MEQAGAPDQELWGPLEQAGLLNKEPTHVTTVETLVHGAPEASWDPRSRANGAPWSKQELQIKKKKRYGPLELGALNQESMGLLRIS